MLIRCVQILFNWGHVGVYDLPLYLFICLFTCLISYLSLFASFPAHSFPYLFLSFRSLIFFLSFSLSVPLFILYFSLFISHLFVFYFFFFLSFFLLHFISVSFSFYLVIFFLLILSIFRSLSFRRHLNHCCCDESSRETITMSTVVVTWGGGSMCLQLPVLTAIINIEIAPKKENWVAQLWEQGGSHVSACSNKKRTRYEVQGLWEVHMDPTNKLVKKCQWKRPRWICSREWYIVIKTERREIRCEDRDWMELAQDKVQWRAFVNAVMNLRLL